MKKGRGGGGEKSKKKRKNIHTKRYRMEKRLPDLMSYQSQSCHKHDENMMPTTHSNSSPLKVARSTSNTNNCLQFLLTSHTATMEL